jgi:NADH-quinone oxidoreductase subunit L
MLIPALPLSAALLTAALGKRVLRRSSHWPTVIAIALSCLASVILVVQVQREAKRMDRPSEIGYEKVVTLWTWASVDDACRPPASTVDRDFRVDIALRADLLTAITLAMVTLLLVLFYSIGYMRGDPGCWRFFTYVPLLVFSVAMLVSASNFVLLYTFWQAVGVCSYLLVGSWFHRPGTVAAGKNALLVGCVGDFGLVLAMFLIWATYGTLNFHDTAGVLGVLGQARLEGTEAFVTGGVATAICLLLLLGACGKSASFLPHVWLSDTVEGPTPAAALICTATTVTAGGYMVVRCVPLFVASDHAREVVAVVGGLTAVLAALIAAKKTRIGRIPIWSAAVVPLEGFARVCCWIDRVVIAGLIDVCGSVPRLIGAVLRSFQNGMIQFYALAMVLGLLVLIGMLLL